MKGILSERVQLLWDLVTSQQKQNMFLRGPENMAHFLDSYSPYFLIYLLFSTLVYFFFALLLLSWFSYFRKEM